MRNQFFFLYTKMIISFFLTCLIFTGTTAFSQTVSSDSLEKEITGKTVDGLMNVSSSLIKDSFIPMTFWQEKEYLVTFVPAYFRINRIYDDPEVMGKDLNGWAAGLGGGYAYKERLIFYGILAIQNIEGKLSGKMYKDPLPAVEADMNFQSLFFSPGAGYEILTGKWFSLPLYFGPYILRYNIDFDLPQESYAGNSIEVSASGSGMLYGLSGGFALSFMAFDKLKITPYYIFMRSFNKPDAHADVAFTTSFPFTNTITQTESLETENLNASMIGLSATLISSNNISFSVSVGGYITSKTSWYNEKFLNGLQMDSIVIAVTYTNSQVKDE